MILNIDRRPAKAIAAIDSYGNNLTYGELVLFSKEIEQFIPERSVVFISAVNNVGGIAWSIGSLNAGVVPLLLNAHIDKDLYQHLYTIYTPQYICVLESDSKNYNFTQVASAYGYVLFKTGNAVYPIHEELSYLLPTSGSTGSPKLVRHCYRNIDAAALNISTFFELTDVDRPLLTLPLYYTMGFSIALSHLYVGATILATDLNMTDKMFWNFIKEQKATSFTGVPYSFEILKLMRFFRMDLPHLTLLTQGGGKMPRQLNLDFAEFAKATGKRWIATYGQTEGSARMAYLPPEYAISKCGSIGIAVPNGELSLIDENGNEILAPNTEGEMCYRGRNVTLGYALKREDLELGDERNGFLRTGDLAYRDEDGCYYIIGRMGRFLKLFGIRVGLDECEQIIKTKYPTECACVGTDEKMTIYITDHQYARHAKEEIVNKTKIVASAFEVAVIKSIPKNEAGKILYSQLINR